MSVINGRRSTPGFPKHSPRGSPSASVIPGMKHPRDPLSSTLQSWHHEPTPAPDFRNQVWARIHAVEATSATTPSTHARPAPTFPFANALPLAASLAVLLSLAAGSGTAFALNQSRATERMAAAYVRTIDPVQMTAASGAHPSHVHP